MEMKPSVQSHHLVPQVNLKRFAVGGQVTVVRRDDAEPLRTLYHPRLVSCKQTCSKPEYYTVYSQDGTPDRYIEDTLSKFENSYPALIKAIRGGKPLDPKTRDTAALLAALQEARSQQMRGTLTGLFSELQRHAVQAFKAYKPDASPEELKQVVAEFCERTITTSDVSHEPENLALLTIASSLKTRYTMMRHMHVSVLVSKAQDFITSDSPMVWVDPLRRDDDWHGFYFMSLSAEATLPLTPRHCLLFSYMPLQPIVELNREEVVQIVNARTMVHSFEEIYLQPKASVVERLSQLASLADRERWRVSLLPSAIEHAGGFITLYDVAEAVGAGWGEVVERNRRVADIWRRLGFADIDLHKVVDVRPAMHEQSGTRVTHVGSIKERY